MKRARPLLLILLAVAGGGAIAWSSFRPASITLTGIVTTNDVVVSPQVAGQIGQLRVNEGDTVRQGQVVAAIVPDELAADTAYYAQNAAGLSSQVRESQAGLRFQQRQTADQTAQAESTLAATEAQVKAAAADVEAARLTFTRTEDLGRQGIASAQELDQARTTFNAAQAKLDALDRKSTRLNSSH